MLAQIGLGHWGKNHARVLSELGQLSAVCDSRTEAVESFAKKYAVDGYSSVDKLITRSKFKAAVIATPTSTHFTIAKQLLESGKHVFIEKPLTKSVKEAELLRQLAEKNKLILTCGFIERFNPAVAAVKRYVNTKLYGRLITLEFHRENRMPSHIRDVGIIQDTAVHDIDTASWLFGRSPKTVYAVTGKIRNSQEDFANLLLDYGKSNVASLVSNWITPNRSRTMTAVFEAAVINCDFITQKLQIQESDRTVIPRSSFAEPLALELAEFIKAVTGKKASIVTPEEAISVLQTAESAMLSGDTGEAMEIIPNKTFF